MIDIPIRANSKLAIRPRVSQARDRRQARLSAFGETCHLKLGAQSPIQRTIATRASLGCARRSRWTRIALSASSDLSKDDLWAVGPQQLSQPFTSSPPPHILI